MPWPDRSVEEWKKELAEDMSLIKTYVNWALHEGDNGDPVVNWAMALKESRRLTSDLYRVAEKAGITGEDIDRQRT